MKKSAKILLSLGGLSTILLPISAISCSNKKPALENQIKISKETLVSLEFDEFKKDLNELVTKATQVLNDPKASNKEFNPMIDQLKKVTSEAKEKNEAKKEEHANNKKLVEKEIDKLKEFSHEKLTDLGEEYNKLKAELVKKYQEEETKHQAIKSIEYSAEKTKGYTAELEKIFNEFKNKKVELDKKFLPKLVEETKKKLEALKFDDYKTKLSQEEFNKIKDDLQKQLDESTKVSTDIEKSKPEKIDKAIFDLNKILKDLETKKS
ncbi:hypothetical protein [Metamycoplasma auris]|uniref:Lipoprotein n=1 Tax=Metamycoplasma auris TaxID=51363 RepID=A0A2W7FZF5_9BACT|nr:hypothetical protein [Metamycoplasma auris]PZV99809.1 hypothetical protein BCF89_10814 [Metamycoplasma auris]